MPNFYHGSAVWLKGPKAKCQRGHVITWLYKIYIRQVKLTLNLFFKDHMMLVKKLALRLLLYTVNALLQDADNEVRAHALGQSIRDNSPCSNPGNNVSSAMMHIPGPPAVLPKWLMNRLQLNAESFVCDPAEYLIRKMAC